MNAGVIPFGRFKGTKEDFDFLGFTFFNAQTRSGKYCASVRTSKKKLKAKRAAVKEWLRSRLTKPISDTMKIVRVSLLGHYNYYGVSGNFKMIQKFCEYVKYTSFRMLNRLEKIELRADNQSESEKSVARMSGMPKPNSLCVNCGACLVACLDGGERSCEPCAKRRKTGLKPACVKACPFGAIE
ncbi:hypothetical protein FACS1894187_21720 [Synergistales bacterium]|nr:hypothetical protein FACS1894187_21720 [Synergistales bacterium]